MVEHFNQRLRRHLIDLPDAQALVAEHTCLTYANVGSRVAQSAHFLHMYGVSHGSVVAIAIKDEIEHVLASITLLVMGAKQITLPSHDTINMQASLVERVSAQWLVTDHAVAHSRVQTIHWPDAQHHTGQDMPDLVTPGTGALFLRTSGTTGLPNIVEFSDAQMSHQSQRHHEYAHERLLRLASIEHNNSKRHRLYAFWNGGTNVFLNAAQVDVFDFIERNHVSCLDISRLHAVGIYKAVKARPLHGTKIRTGGSAIPYTVRANITEHLTEQLYVRYATTETGSIAMAQPGEHGEHESSGHPLHGVTVSIFDAHGQAVPPGEIGQIGIQCAGMATSYVDNPAQSAERFKHGWFYPGDMGQKMPDGQLLVLGRSDDMIVMNGLNIFPKEIEDILDTHPLVTESAALALPSKHHGQIPVAAVSLRKGVHIDAEELLAFCKPLLGMKTPRKIVILAQLPRTPQGKVLKRELPPCFKPSLGGGHAP